jgi:hypothetical protein
MLPIARSRKKEWLKGKCCCKCGEVHSLMIEYPDPKLSFQVWVWAKPARRNRHLSRAKVWCQKHYTERLRDKKLNGLVVTHGMAQMYRRGCRCAECKKAICKYQMDRVAKRRS